MDYFQVWIFFLVETVWPKAAFSIEAYAKKKTKQHYQHYTLNRTFYQDVLSVQFVCSAFCNTFKMSSCFCIPVLSS